MGSVYRLTLRQLSGKWRLIIMTVLATMPSRARIHAEIVGFGSGYDCHATLTPHPASVWAHGLSDVVLGGPASGMTDAVLDDEFPLSMFYEALSKKMGDVIDSTKGITASTPDWKAPAA